MDQKRFSNIIIIVGAVIFALMAGYFIGNRQTFFQKSAREINSFKECAKSGYPIAESYPRQCRTPDGRNFVEKLTIEEAQELLSQSLFDKEGVVGVGIGKCDGTPCIKIMLERELEDVAVPSEFHGFKVETQVAGLFCTQEAKICPDGSAVGRTGPNCEFDPCPKETREGVSQISLREGERESSFLLEKIYSDRITGLNFPEYPVGGGPGYPLTLRIGEIASNGCTITLTLTRIEGNIATFVKKTDFNRPCPICLAGSALIDTPFGLVAIKDLQVGMPIWTTDKFGDRVSEIVAKVSKVPVPATHQMVHLVLDDGRELFVSPGHPTVDGRAVGNLAIGEMYNGASVLGAERVPYGENATYDVLPGGETGFYWANGVLLGSTLYRR